MTSARELKRYKEMTLENTKNKMVQAAWKFLNKEVQEKYEAFLEEEIIRISKDELEEEMDKALEWAKYPHFSEEIRKKANEELAKNLLDRGWKLMCISSCNEVYWALCPISERN